MSETTTRTSILALIHNRGGWAIVTDGVALAGAPDLIGAYRGVPLALEIKQPGQHPRPNQRLQLQLAARAGATACVLRSREQAARLLDEIDWETSRHHAQPVRRVKPTESFRSPSAVLAALKAACEAHPDQRVMQVIVNALGPDPFYVEDAQAIQRLNDFTAGRQR